MSVDKNTGFDGVGSAHYGPLKDGEHRDLAD